MRRDLFFYITSSKFFLLYLLFRIAPAIIIFPSLIQVVTDKLRGFIVLNGLIFFSLLFSLLEFVAKRRVGVYLYKKGQNATFFFKLGIFALLFL